jgi:hypothetical protein
LEPGALKSTTYDIGALERWLALVGVGTSFGTWILNQLRQETQAGIGIDMVYLMRYVVP